MQNTRNKYMIIHGIEPYKHGENVASLIYFTPVPGTEKKPNVLELYGSSNVESALQMALLDKKSKSSLDADFTDNDIVARRKAPWFDRENRDQEKATG